MARTTTWTAAQVDDLLRLRGRYVCWTEVVQVCGHSRPACQTKLAEVRKKRREQGSGEPPPKRGRPPTPYTPPVVMASTPEPVVPPSARTCRTSLLQADAELRARIELLGATGGLLGDPLPGRSALDRKREEAWR